MPNKIVGAMVVAAKSFEVFIQKGNPKELDWENFTNSILDYVHEFDLEIDFTDVVTFYVHANKDLSGLATKILPFILKPSEKTLQTPKETKSIFFVRVPGNKSIIEIKDHEAVKKGRTLKRAVWHMIKYLGIKASTLAFYFEDAKGNQYVSKRTFTDIPIHLVQDIQWTSEVKYKKKEIPIYLKLEKTLPLFSKDQYDALLNVDGFPYFTDERYFNLGGYDFGKHSIIVGQTGVGKSKFIALLVEDIAKKGLLDEYAILIVDPHAALYTDLLNIPKAINIDFRETATELFSSVAEPKIATELTITLLKTLLKEQFTGRMEQVMKYSIFALISAGQMTLFNLRKFLTENQFRTEVLEKVANSENLMQFFNTEFLEITTKNYDTAIMPVLTLVDELNFLPVFSRNASITLESAMKNNFLTVFSLSRIFLGERATKLIAGLIIQQIFLIAQTQSVKKKIILIVDEVPAVENDALITILAEARKFNLSLFLSMQYLSQVKPELLRGILSNSYNFFVFKTTEEDSKLLVKNLLVEIPDEVIKSYEDIGESKDDLKIKLMTTLDVRQCLARPYKGTTFFPVFKGRTIDVK